VSARIALPKPMMPAANFHFWPLFFQKMGEEVEKIFQDIKKRVEKFFQT
jgi:hypothetical protein